MKAAGIARRIDDLGRIEIPKQIRQRFGIRKGDILEIYTDRDGTISFRKVPEKDGALLQAQNPSLRVNCDRCGRQLLPVTSRIQLWVLTFAKSATLRVTAQCQWRTYSLRLRGKQKSAISSGIVPTVVHQCQPISATNVERREPCG